MDKKTPEETSNSIWSNGNGPENWGNGPKYTENANVEKEIGDTFSKDFEGSWEETKKLLQKEVEALEKNKRNQRKTYYALENACIDQLEEVNQWLHEYFKIINEMNEEFEKRLFVEKLHIWENIRKILFEDDRSANILDVATELANIHDEQTRWYLLFKIMDKNSTLFNPHSNYNRDIYSTTNIDKAGEMIGLKKYGIEAGSNPTSTGRYYGYYAYQVKAWLKAKGVEIKSTYKVEYAYGYNNHFNSKGKERQTKNFALPLFFDDAKYTTLHNEFFEKHPNSKAKLIKIQNDIADKAQETNSIYDECETKQKEPLQNEENIDKALKEQEKKYRELKEEYTLLTKWWKENAEAYRKFKKKHGGYEILKQIVEKNPNFDLQKFLDTTPYAFINDCEYNNLRPCTDGKHQIGIQIQEAPSINKTGAGQQYGKNISVWYDGKFQETKYFKRRDGYSASNDAPENHFDKVVDISVDDSTWEIHVLVQAEGYAPKEIVVQMIQYERLKTLNEEKKITFEYAKEKADHADIVLVYRDNGMYQEIMEKLKTLNANKRPSLKIYSVIIPSNAQWITNQEEVQKFIDTYAPITDTTIAQRAGRETEKIEKGVEINNEFFQKLTVLNTLCKIHGIRTVYLLTSKWYAGEYPTDNNYLLQHGWYFKNTKWAYEHIDANPAYNKNEKFTWDQIAPRKEFLKDVEIKAIGWDSKSLHNKNSGYFTSEVSISSSSLLIVDRHCYDAAKLFEEKWGKSLPFAWTYFEKWFGELFEWFNEKDWVEKAFADIMANNIIAIYETRKLSKK